ncbi:MAG TPA: hypothetical protein VKV27_06690 [Solirubrobacteraceae bacterium]|nr:hypothetical protein [Solirubrobacteraceae bacterium]
MRAAGPARLRRAAVWALALGALSAGGAQAAASGAIQASEGQQFSGQVASIAIDCAAALASGSGTIAWGDGQSSPAQFQQASSSQLDVSGSHIYGEEGAYSGSVSGSWSCGGGSPQPFSATFSAQVADAPLSATGAGTLSAVAGQAFSAVVASFTDADPGGAAGDYSATIDWGDGSAPGAGTVSATSGGGFSVSGSHTYAAPGSYRTTVTIDDAGGASATAGASVDVSQAGAGAAAISVSPASLSFHVDWSAYSQANANSTPQTVTVKSVGSAPLSISAVKVVGVDSGGLAISCPSAGATKPCHPADTCSGQTLAPGASCSVSVEYDAADAFPSPSGSLQIDSNAPSSPTLVALNGTSTDLDTQPPPGAPPPPGGCPGTIGDGPFGYQTSGGGLLLTGCFADLQTQAAEEAGSPPLWVASGDVSINGITLVPFSGTDHLYFAPSYGGGPSYGSEVTDLIYATGSDTRYLVVVPYPPKLLALNQLLGRATCYVCNLSSASSDALRSHGGPVHAAILARPPLGAECPGCNIALAGYLPPPGFAVGVVNLGLPILGAGGGQPFVCAHGEVTALGAQPCLGAQWQLSPDSPPDRINGLPVQGGEITFQDCGGGNWLAQVTANAQLPSLFSQGPDSGGPVTTGLSFLGCPQPPPNDCSEGCLPQGSGGAGAGNCIGTTCYGQGRPPTRAQVLTAGSGRTEGRGQGSPAPPSAALRPPSRNARSGRPPTAGARMLAHDQQSGPCPSDQQDVLGALGDAFVGGMGFGQPYLCYDPASDVWTVGGKFDLLQAQVDSGPPPDYGIGFHSDGRFDHGGIESVDLGDPGVAIIPPLVYLNDFGGAFKVDPTFITAHAKLTVADVVGVDGGGFAVWATPEHPYTYTPLCDNQGNCTDPIPGVDDLQADTRSVPITTFAAGAGGTVSLKVPALGDLPLGGAYLAYIDPGYFEFGGHMCLGSDPSGSNSSCAFPELPFYVSASVLGALDAQSKDFNIQGGLTACADFPWPINTQCLSLQGLVSNEGIGACVSGGNRQPDPHKPPQGGVGFRYQWGGSFVPFIADCDLGPIFVDVYAQSGLRARADATGVGVRLRAHLPVAEVIVRGRGGAPLLAISGPGGQHLQDQSASHPAVSTPIVISPLPALGETVIALNHPRGGVWRVSALPGSAPITEVEHLDGLAPASVSARVLGRGRARTLIYRIRPRPGQRVSFFERAGQVWHLIGSARSSSGRIGFQAADGPGGRRLIVAIISLGGVPSQRLVVASFTAPPREAPARPQRLRLRRRGASVVISWAAVRGAQRYLIDVALSDGRRLAFIEPAHTHALRIGAVSGQLTARVTLRALGLADVPGPSAAAGLAAASRPGRVRGLRARRVARGVLISWRRAPGAGAYLVLVAVPAQHSPSVPLITARTRVLSRLTLPSLRAGQSARITVVALSRTGARGQSSTISYRRLPAA